MATYTEVRKLDLLKHNGTAGGIPPIVLRRGDSGTIIKAEVTYGGDTFVLTNYTAKFCAVNAAGAVVRRTATVTNAADGIVEYEVTTDLTSVVGPVLVAYFELTSTDGKIATTDTLPFIILADADLDAGAAEEYQSVIDELISTLTAAIADAQEATGRANSAADDAAAVIDNFVVNYDDLSDECKEFIAASASAGVELATEEDVAYAFDNIVAPAIAGGESAGRITAEDYEAALNIIFG